MWAGKIEGERGLRCQAECCIGLNRVGWGEQARHISTCSGLDAADRLIHPTGSAEVIMEGERGVDTRWSDC